MAEPFARIVIKGDRELIASMRDIERRTNRATMYAVREAGRRTKTEAKRRAPSYTGAGVASRREHAAGASDNRPVKGLLRASIHSSRRLKRDGDAYVNHVAPRGARVHLYSQKVEAIYHYMRDAHDTVAPMLRTIAAAAWTRSTRGR